MQLFKHSALTLLMAIMLIDATVVIANPSEDTILKATFYEDFHLAGNAFSLETDHPNLLDLVDEQGIAWDDRIASLRLYGNTCATVYLNADYNPTLPAEIPYQQTFYPQKGRIYTDHYKIIHLYNKISSIHLHHCQPQAVKTKVTLYSDVNKQGQSITFNINQANLAETVYDLPQWNNRIKSIQLGENTCAVLYEKPNFEGRKVSYFAREATVTDYNVLENFNDYSLETYDCEPIQYKAVFYENAHLEGESITLLDNQTNLADLIDEQYRHWEDRISSMRLYNGTCATVYVERDYQINNTAPEPNLLAKTYHYQALREYTDFIELKDFRGKISSIQ